MKKLLLFLLKAIAYLLMMVFIVSANLILTAIIGALSGFIVDWLLGEPILRFSSATSEVFVVYMWQIGTVFGFVCGFFKNHIKINLKK